MNEKSLSVDKKSAKDIIDYISKKKPKTTRKGDIIVNGKSTSEFAYTLPRRLLKLNLENHRFTTAISTLKEERLNAGKDPDFDLTKKSDVEEIRNMLRGIEPSNTYRKTQYDKLFSFACFNKYPPLDMIQILELFFNPFHSKVTRYEPLILP